MIRLQAVNQVTGVETEIDLFGDETISITLTVDDLRDFGSKNASFTKDFDLPATKNNNKFFEQVYNLDVDSSYNPRAKTEAVISDDGVVIFSGSMYLNEVLEKNGLIVYRINVYSEVVNFIDALGEATLADLDYTDLAHTFNAANVEASWGQGVTLTAGGTSDNVFYPLIDTGNVTYNWANGFTLNYHSALNYIPFVKLHYILEKMFDFAGFTCESNFFDTTYFKSIYTDTNTDSQANDYTYDTIEVRLVGGGFGFATQVIDGDTTVDFDQELDDANGLYNLSTNTYTAPADNIEVYIEGDICFEGKNGDSIEVFAEVTIGGSTNNIILSTGTIYNTAFGTIYLDSDDVITANAGFYDTIQLENTGDTIVIKVKTLEDTDSADDFPRITDNAQLINFVTNPDTVISEYYTNAFFGTISNNISIDEKMKLYRQDTQLADVFKDITKLFNLVVEPVNNRRIKVEPYNDYNDGGVIRYWEEKVDRSEIKHDFYPIPSKITFAYNNDEDDYMINLYESIFNGFLDAGALGGMQIYPNTTQIDEKEIKLEVFSFTAYNGYMPQIFTEVDLQRIPFQNKPRLIHKLGAAQAITEDEINVVTTNAYGHSDDNTVYVDAMQGLYFSPIYGNTSLYETFWHDYIQDRYTENGVIINVRIKLTAGDIANFSFADLIIIDNQTYRVNKIEYQAGSSELAKVELLKVFINKGGAFGAQAFN